MSGRAIRFGIAGWSYDDWRGVVYPRSCKDTLRFVAEFVDVIEINSSFYRLPSPRNSESWVTRTEDLGTVFTAKLPQDFTHAMAKDDRAAAETREGFAPLVAAGRLHTLLAQFSFRFRRSKANLAHLAWLRDEFSATAPLTVEVRHATWATPEGLEDLRGLGVAVANLDYPGFDTGFGVRETGINGPHDTAYFRIHGRNADAWFDKDAGRDEVYDYEYSASELSELDTRARELAATAGDTIVVANNHFQGKAMKLVVELLAAHEDAKVSVPAPLAQRYPALQDISDTGQQGLLF